MGGICSPRYTVEACEKTCIGLGFNEHSHCIKDEFGAAKFDTAYDPYCVYDYTALIWSRVDELFPIQYLHDLCKRERLLPTGNDDNSNSLDLRC